MAFRNHPAMVATDLDLPLHNRRPFRFRHRHHIRLRRHALYPEFAWAPGFAQETAPAIAQPAKVNLWQQAAFALVPAQADKLADFVPAPVAARVDAWSALDTVQVSGNRSATCNASKECARNILFRTRVFSRLRQSSFYCRRAIRQAQKSNPAGGENDACV